MSVVSAPCPFCEHKNIELVKVFPAGANHGWSGHCPRCKTDGPIGNTPLDALQSWDHRPIEQKLRLEQAAMLKAIVEATEKYEALHEQLEAAGWIFQSKGEEGNDTETSDSDEV